MLFRINMASRFLSFFRKYRQDIFLIILILGTVPLFFYKLGQSSLVSWDEAWYAGIARNIIKSGDFLRLSWVGAPFFDHPPAGLWWIALSFKILGITSFSARFPSAVFGLSTLVATYFLGRELFGRWVGFSAALALTSAPWFLFRARSGNLDIFLTFFFVLSIFLAIKSLDNKKYFLPLGISLSLLFLTKTLVPLAVTAPLIIIYWNRKIDRKSVIRAAAIFISIVGIWFIAQITRSTWFIERYFQIGLPGISGTTSYRENFQLVKDYIHIGIGKWFWPSVLALVGSLFIRKRSFYILPVFCLVFTIPFLLSHKTQIWHLIPLYPFLLISLFGFGFSVINKLTKKNIIAAAAILAIAVYFSFIQTRNNWYQFINIPAFISDEQTLSEEAGKYPEPLYIDGDFVPAAVFYSGKDVVRQVFCRGPAGSFWKG